MADRVAISFTKLAGPESGSAVTLTDKNLKLGPRSAGLDTAAGTRSPLPKLRSSRARR